MWGKKIKKRTSGGVVKELGEEERRGLNMTSVFIPSPLQDLTSIFTWSLARAPFRVPPYFCCPFISPLPQLEIFIDRRIPRVARNKKKKKRKERERKKDEKRRKVWFDTREIFSASVNFFSRVMIERKF